MLAESARWKSSSRTRATGASRHAHATASATASNSRARSSSGSRPPTRHRTPNAPRPRGRAARARPASPRPCAAERVARTNSRNASVHRASGGPAASSSAAPVAQRPPSCSRQRLQLPDEARLPPMPASPETIAMPPRPTRARSQMPRRARSSPSRPRRGVDRGRGADGSSAGATSSAARRPASARVSAEGADPELGGQRRGAAPIGGQRQVPPARRREAPHESPVGDLAQGVPGEGLARPAHRAGHVSVALCLLREALERVDEAVPGAVFLCPAPSRRPGRPAGGRPPDRRPARASRGLLPEEPVELLGVHLARQVVGEPDVERSASR